MPDEIVGSGDPGAVETAVAEQGQPVPDPQTAPAAVPEGEMADEIITEFPELKDNTSPLFRETAIRYRKAVAADPSAMKRLSAIYEAAYAAREFLKGKRNAKEQTTCQTTKL